MIVFRFDDLTTIGNHVRNMPCGSPCRFVISKGGDSSATVVLTSNETTISATSESIAPFSTDEYVGFDIVTPAESANIPYHAVITGTNGVQDIDFILNCNRQTLCGDTKYIIKIDDLDSIGSHSYTVPTNSNVDIETKLETGEALSFPAGSFPSQTNVPSNVGAYIPPVIAGVFDTYTQLQILTSGEEGQVNVVGTVHGFKRVENGVYDSGTTTTRFTGYNEEDEAEYLIDIYPKDTFTCNRLINGVETETPFRFVDVAIRDLEGNKLASSVYIFYDHWRGANARQNKWYYGLNKTMIVGEWKDIYPTSILFVTTRSTTEPSTPTSVAVPVSKAPDGTTTASCAGETKYSYVAKPIKQFDITITNKDTGFSYSK
jgi:hypothetical protein